MGSVMLTGCCNIRERAARRIVLARVLASEGFEVGRDSVGLVIRSEGRSDACFSEIGWHVRGENVAETATREVRRNFGIAGSGTNTRHAKAND